ncbi:MAG: twin-arginine translocase TatA/TatE family subunit [Candidatus Thermoplasmatota archaeon]|nr:twin-arginine translocase TatA/TatE family subunit [Candidatus Thermoplasmatota archaeon]
MALGPQEMFFLAIVVFFLFGAKRIPELARNVGRAKGEFKIGIKEANEMASISDMDRGGMTEDVASEQE